MKSEVFHTPNAAGWNLEIRRFSDPARLDKSRRPIVMIPGYCMNTFILSYHPAGTSMVHYLVEHGFEVWTANLRGQGGSRRIQGPRKYGFRELALVDFPRVRDFVLANTATEAKIFDAVGCSLGATVLFAYLGHNPEQHGIGSLVTVGGPLRWNRVHPLVRALLSSPSLAGSVPVFGTRQLARAVLPALQKAPFLLSLYMNPKLVDLSAADELVKTIDDPSSHLTRQIAHWVRNRDLVVGGLNITHALHPVQTPTMVILANQDGIVPPEAALSVFDHIGSTDNEILRVGTPEVPYAHADMFISKDADKNVFEPMANWLVRHY
ncbi:MAG: alpha/beta fold hydrolase [Bradymonadaceae bacterium]|nr:alpha/beta fold hydrolase [Lujinxingiaceae bacterium]